LSFPRPRTKHTEHGRREPFGLAGRAPNLAPRAPVRRAACGLAARGLQHVASGHAVTKAILTSPGFIQAFGAAAADAGTGLLSEGGDCLSTTLSPSELDAVLPTLTLIFGKGPTVTVTANATQAYLIPSGPGSWCGALLSLAPDSGYPFVVSLGAPILRSSVVVFDRAKRRLGFAPHTPCP
jgi:hypothetical protein